MRKLLLRFSKHRTTETRLLFREQYWKLYHSAYLPLLERGRATAETMSCTGTIVDGSCLLENTANG